VERGRGRQRGLHFGEVAERVENLLADLPLRSARGWSGLPPAAIHSAAYEVGMRLTGARVRRSGRASGGWLERAAKRTDTAYFALGVFTRRGRSRAKIRQAARAPLLFRGLRAKATQGNA